MAYALPIDPIHKTNYGEARDVIDNKEYLNSMLQFKAPAVIKEWTLVFHYVVKDTRHWYSLNLQTKIENVLKKFEIWYLVDKNSQDTDNIKLYEKLDRQLMILGFVVVIIVLLNIWQLLQFVSWCVNELLSPVETEKQVNRMIGRERNEAMRA